MLELIRRSFIGRALLMNIHNIYSLRKIRNMPVIFIQKVCYLINNNVTLRMLKLNKSVVKRDSEPPQSNVHPV